MSEVTALNSKGLTPEVLLDQVKKDVGKLQEIFIVGIGPDGSHHIYSSGRLDSLTYAILLLQRFALDCLNDQIEDE